MTVTSLSFLWISSPTFSLNEDDFIYVIWISKQFVTFVSIESTIVGNDAIHQRGTRIFLEIGTNPRMGRQLRIA